MSGLEDQYAFSVDIGTSTLAVRLLSLSTGEPLCESRVGNPQNRFGLDVITRARFATSSASKMHLLVSVVRKKIWEVMDALLRQEAVLPEEIVSVVVCGNTVMQYLFYNRSVSALLRPPYQPDYSPEFRVSARELGWPLDCEVYSPPIVASFIGSDAVAVLMDALENEARPMVVIDVGTNTEISVVHDDGIWTASAPSGPAFEGMSVACGMPADVGAIRRVTIGPGPCDVKWSTVSEAAPRGICGTGIISLVAELRRVGVINETGSILRGLEIPCIDAHRSPVIYTIVDGSKSHSGRPIYLSQVDVRMVQQSKAAIRATIEMVLRASGLRSADIEHLYITGAFGEDLSLEDAYDIGLFPKFENASCRQEVGGALRGADLLNSDRSYRSRAASLVEMVHYVELMDNSEFEERMAMSQVFKRQ